MPATDDLDGHSVSRSESSSDAGDRMAIDVKLYAGAQEWLLQLLRREDDIPTDSQRPSVTTHPERPGLSDSAVLHVENADCVSRTRETYTCLGRLDLPLGTLPVAVVFCDIYMRRGVVERSLREVHGSATQMHPRIMIIIGCGVAFDRLVLVLPDLGGADFRTYMRNHPKANKRRLIIQIAEGLEYLHRQKSYLYGVLTPSLVRVTDFGDVVLDDHRLRVWNPEEGERALFDRAVEHEQSLEYLAPETLLADYRPSPSFSSQSARFRTRERDMYAFGMFVYEILSGRKPWADAKLVDIFRYIVSGQLLPRPEDGSIDDAMWNLCTACWNQNPADRPGIVNILAGLRCAYPPTRWRPDATVQGELCFHSERPSLEGYALDVEIDETIVNIVLQKQEAAAGGFSTVRKGYSYQKGVITTYAAKICRGKSIMPREYEIWKSLQHQNILRLLGTVETNLTGIRELIFVSPYAENGNLTRFLELFPHAGRLSLMIGVARGLAYLHDIQKIVHGDIKPENILVNGSFQAVLADFGFSTYVAPGPEETLLEMRQVYTLTYCAPEVLDDTAEDPSHPGVIRSKTRMSDMYAYGVLLYQTYAGGLGDSRRARMRLMLDMHDGHFPPRPVGHKPVLCDDLWSLCKRCWLRDPLQRPTVATVLAELEDLLLFPERQEIETVES